MLLYASDSGSSYQEVSKRWLETELSSGRSVGFALVTLLAFVRIAPDRCIFSRPGWRPYGRIDSFVEEAS